MPVFSQPISNQVQAAGSGSSNYPRIGAVVQGSKMMDTFNRTTLNASGMPALYVTGGVGTPTVTVQVGRQLTVKTDGTLNDNAYCVLSELAFGRSSYYVDEKSSITFELTWIMTNSTALQCFIGLEQASTGDTALPTTAISMGVYVDTSVSNNWKLTSADGTTQTTTDTGISVAGNYTFRLEIIWNGNDSATLNFYTTPSSIAAGNTWTGIWTLQKTQTVSSLITSNQWGSGLFLHWFIQTLAAATKQLTFLEWGANTT